MKSTAVWVLRHLIIPVAFIWSTGIFSTCNKIDFSNNLPKDAYHTFTDSEASTLEINPTNAVAYCDTLVALRTRQVEKTGYYDPMDYFHDLKQLRMFETIYKDSLENSTNGRIIYMCCASPMGATNKLCNLRDCKQKRFWTEEELENARHYWFPLDAIHDAEAKKNPVQWWRDIFSPLLAWMLRVHLRGLPIALIMILLWKRRLKKDINDEYWGSKEEKPSIDCGFAPLSFILSLLLWPIILWIDIRNRWKQVMRRTEVLSRRNSMLSMLSTADQKLLETGSKMSLKEFRDYLESIGKVRKHSFIMALAITVLTSTAPKIIVPAYAMQLTETTVMNSSVPARMDNDVGSAVHRTVHAYDYEAILPPRIEPEPKSSLDIIHFLRKQIGQVLSGFASQTCGVPKATNQLRLKLIS